MTARLLPDLLLSRDFETRSLFALQLALPAGNLAIAMLAPIARVTRPPQALAVAEALFAGAGYPDRQRPSSSVSRLAARR